MGMCNWREAMWETSGADSVVTPVGTVLVRKVKALQSVGEAPPYTIELMIG